MCEKFRNLPSLAARSWVFQACPGEQRMVESSLPVSLVLIRVKHAGGKEAHCISTPAYTPLLDHMLKMGSTPSLGLWFWVSHGMCVLYEMTFQV